MTNSVGLGVKENLHVKELSMPPSGSKRISGRFPLCVHNCRKFLVPQNHKTL
jgi:hypothetical protein